MTTDRVSPSEKASSIANAVYYEAPLALGFAVHVWWTCMLITDLFSGSFDSNVLHTHSSIVLCAAFLVSFAAGCLAAGILRERITRYIRRKWAHFVVSLLGVGSCVLVALPDAPGGGGMALLGCIGAGVSCSFSTVLWGEAARRRDFATLALVSSVALSAALIGALAAQRLLADDLAHVAVCAGPLVSGVLIYKAQHDNASYLKPQEFLLMPDGTKQIKEGQRWVETFHDLRIERWRFAMKIGRCGVAFGIVLGCLGIEAYRLLESSASTLPLLTATAVPLCAACAFFVMYFKTTVSHDRINASRRLFPFFTILFALSCSTTFLNGELGGPACIAALAILATMLWMYPCELTHRYRISSMLTFGFFFAFLSLGALGAAVVFFVLPAHDLADVAVAIAIIVCSILGAQLAVTERQMKEIALVDEANESTPLPTERFTYRCQYVADTFLLSGRELEVLTLLARGRNASYIQRALVISEGTVRTHMRNIYRKLNVHSQQEVIDLVEQAPFAGKR